MLSTPKSRGELFLASSLRDGLEDNDIKQVETLLSSKEADPNVLIPTHGISPFHLVIGNESEKFAEQVTKLFLRHGGNPNVRSADGMTPVHVAAAWGRINVLELLLANGGDPLCLDDDGRSPFHYAFDGAYYDAVATLGKYCGMNHDEDDSDEPKYKLTLDKIFVNKGNVVAEYVTSDDSYGISIKSESCERDENSKGESTNKILKTESLNLEQNSRMENRNRSDGDGSDGGGSNGGGSNGDNFNWSRSNNVTLRRYHKNCKEAINEEKVEYNEIDEYRMEEERRLIGRIINRLSNKFSSDDTTIIDKTMKNETTRLATVVKKSRRFIAPPKYHSRNYKSREIISHKRLVDTSIISKSPNCQITVKNNYKIETPSNKRCELNKITPKSLRQNSSKSSQVQIKSASSTPKKRCPLKSQSQSCRKNYYEKNPLHSSKSSELPIKSSNSTPKKKKYNNRLCEMAKLPIKIVTTKNFTSMKNRDKTPTILDKTYSKGDNKIGADSSDTETREWNFDRKLRARKIAINLDARMYDENSENYCDSSSNLNEYETKIINSTNTERGKSKQIYDVKKKMIDYGKNRQRYNTESKIPTLNNFHRERNKIEKKNEEFDIKSTKISKVPKLKLKKEPEKKFHSHDYEDRANISFLESPGSSNPISACRMENSSSFIRKRFDFNDNEDDDDDNETKIFLEIEEASKKLCATPPASVSILKSDDSSSSMDNSLLDDRTISTKYETITTDDPSTTGEFYEASTNIPASSRIISSWSRCESFISVEEEYTYEDEEEGVAFIERRLCVIPPSTHDDMNRAKEESSWIDRLGELSIATSDEYSPEKLTRSRIFDDKTLREKLTALGEMPGPITKTTLNVYLKRLWRLESEKKKEIKLNTIESKNEKNVESVNMKKTSKISNFILSIDWKTNEEMYRNLEISSFKEYAMANPKRKYRGGISKTSFCYLLLDPRVTKDLPRCGIKLTLEDRWEKFLNGVFYVGKGKAARPAAHLYDAFGVWSKKGGTIDNASRKIRRILDIWQNGQGVVCLHVFSHTMMEEACSREAAMIDALETSHLTNCLRGTYYGYATTMSIQEKRSLGKYLLYKSMEIFMHEGERQLFPRNVIM